MLVIFDCDGVLVDSEGLAAEVFSLLLAEQGMDIPPADCYQAFHGHSLSYCYAWIEKRFERALPNTFDQQLAAATQRRFAEDLTPVAGIECVLETLQENEIPFCVASNGAHAKIKHSLAITGLDRFFPEVRGATRRFSAQDVNEGKPSPALFLLASNVVGVPADCCTVVEDSPAGFMAAQAAGMSLVRFVPSPKHERQVEGQCFTMSDVLKQLIKPEVN
ncbi:HAD family hydrolase [Teredinibacter purpureus]|uniref:HAD family hydrolase n=1 Tax=Teredinibacter purpureus TaxID=2731756 RepID=UPI0005F84942|nr:HAD family phosphatase [Teredinibacter purpureus]